MAIFLFCTECLTENRLNGRFCVSISLHSNRAQSVPEKVEYDSQAQLGLRKDMGTQAPQCQANMV
jgi:hypothetical protein